jgi:tRNA(Ile)-lysidine synthase
MHSEKDWELFRQYFEQINKNFFAELKKISSTITPAEKKLVKALANECSATFVSLTVDTPKEKEEKKCSLEEAARHLRYQALKELRKQYNAQCIAVGHTSDDQAEEILLRLIRGTGSAGLSGMALKTEYIIRPLLHESKETLRDYLVTHKLCYCEDSSNSDLRFLRNKIRLDLLPYLEQTYNPAMRSTLIQTAAILAEENKFLDSLSEQIFHKSCMPEKDKLTLDIAILNKEDIAIKRRVFEKICWSMAAKPSFKQVSSLLNLICLQNGSEIHLTNGLRAIKQRKIFSFTTRQLNRVIEDLPSQQKHLQQSQSKTWGAIQFLSSGSSYRFARLILMNLCWNKLTFRYWTIHLSPFHSPFATIWMVKNSTL